MEDVKDPSQAATSRGANLEGEQTLVDLTEGSDTQQAGGLDEQENHSEREHATTDEEIEVAMDLDTHNLPETPQRLGGVWTEPAERPTTPGGPWPVRAPGYWKRPWPNCLLRPWRPWHRPRQPGEPFRYQQFLKEAIEWRHLEALRASETASGVQPRGRHEGATSSAGPAGQEERQPGGQMQSTQIDAQDDAQEEDEGATEEDQHEGVDK